MDLNPYSSPETFEVSGIRHRPSRLAAASFVLNVLSGIAIFTLVGFAVVATGQRTPQRAMVVGIVGLIILFLNLSAAALGIIGLIQTGNIRLLAAIVAIAAVTVLGLSALLFAS